MEEKLSQKWAVASFFNDIEDGYKFHRSDNPLHATLAGVFAINLKGDEIVEVLEKTIANLKSFEVYGDKIFHWGEIEVTTLKKSQSFNVLYKKIQSSLLRNGAVFNEPQYLHEGFTPHVTKQKISKLEPNQRKLIKTISLVDMFPDNDGYSRRIFKTIRLNS